MVNLAESRLVLEPDIAGLAATRIEEQLSTRCGRSCVMDRNLHHPTPTRKQIWISIWLWPKMGTR